MENCVIRKITVYHPMSGEVILWWGSDTELKLAEVGEAVEIYDGDEGYSKVAEFSKSCIVVKLFDILGDGTTSDYSKGPLDD